MLKQHPDFPNFFASEHPLISHKLTHMRNKQTDKQAFTTLCREVTMLLVYEATQQLKTVDISVETPITTMQSPVLADEQPVVVPILRAGLGMVDGILKLLPTARVGHIGLYRDEETFEPHLYFFKIPKHSEKSQYFVCDPMLATGGSASACITKLKEAGVQNIILICLIAAPEGVAVMLNDHPDVPIHCAKLDEKLNENCFIVPGLGDAGDRIFGTC